MLGLIKLYSLLGLIKIRYYAQPYQTSFFGGPRQVRNSPKFVKLDIIPAIIKKDTFFGLIKLKPSLNF